MTPLRQRMTNDMTVRGLAENTKRSYLTSVTGLARHYRRSPDQISAQEVQDYLIYLHEQRGLSWKSCNCVRHGVRFLYRITLGVPDPHFYVPGAKTPSTLPQILNHDELVRLFTVTTNPKHRALLMTAYAAGLRASELGRLQLTDIDSGVDPNSWTPDPLGRRYPPCRDQDRRTRRSSGARWLSWCEPDGVRKSCHESSSRRRRRSATGSCKPSVTRGVAGMGQAPRSERSCVAFAGRIGACAKNETSWQKQRPGLLGRPYRGGLPVHESESGRVSNRHDGPSARSLPERVLRVAYT